MQSPVGAVLSPGAALSAGAVLSDVAVVSAGASEPAVVSAGAAEPAVLSAGARVSLDELLVVAAACRGREAERGDRAERKHFLALDHGLPFKDV